MCDTQVKTKGDEEMRCGETGKSGLDSGRLMQRPWGRRPVYSENGQRAGGRGSMRRSEEEIREVKGQHIDLALTLSGKGSGGF